jgi:hypothetical protein
MNLTQREQGLWTAIQRRARVWLYRFDADLPDEKLPDCTKLDIPEDRVARLIDAIIGPTFGPDDEVLPNV